MLVSCPVRFVNIVTATTIKRIPTRFASSAYTNITVLKALAANPQ